MALFFEIGFGEYTDLIVAFDKKHNGHRTTP
jgi:hypothetical protein